MGSSLELIDHFPIPLDLYLSSPGTEKLTVGIFEEFLVC